jgi:hypothetical protein
MDRLVCKGIQTCVRNWLGELFSGKNHRALLGVFDFGLTFHLPFLRCRASDLIFTIQ